MKKILLTICLACITLICHAQQPNEVTLVVSGEGATKEEAINQALRSAIEPAFGVFVSANTEILNDDIVKDEVATVTSGNIQSYKELGCMEAPNGNICVSIEALVSIGKLIEFSHARGITCELAGSSIAANMKLFEFNATSTWNALVNLYYQMATLSQEMYDYVIRSSTPIVGPDVVYLDLEIDVVANRNTKVINDYVYQTLKALSCSKEEITQFSSMGYQIYSMFLKRYDVNVKPKKSLIRFRPQEQDGFLFCLDPDEKNNGIENLAYFYNILPPFYLQLLLDSCTFLEAIDNNSIHYQMRPPMDWRKDYRFKYQHRTDGPFVSSVMLPPITGFYNLDFRGWSSSHRFNKIFSIPETCELVGAIVLGDFNEGDVVKTLKRRIGVDSNSVQNITELTVKPVPRTEIEKMLYRIQEHQAEYYDYFEM